MDASVLLVLLGGCCVQVCLVSCCYTSGQRLSGFLRLFLSQHPLFGKQTLIFQVLLFSTFPALSFGLLKNLGALWCIYKDAVELSGIMQIKEEEVGNVYGCEL